MTSPSELPPARPPASDLLVVGAGPAGLSVARHAARLGLQVVVAAPQPERAWTNNYGVWTDELAGLEESATISHRFARPEVWLGNEATVLDRSYARLDTLGLQRQLLAACLHAGVTFVDARARAVEHHGRGSRATFDDASQLDALCVVDATGYRSRFVERADRRRPAFQSAYGELIDVESHPYPPGTMALMDYRPIPGAEDAPTFLYAMPLSPHAPLRRGDLPRRSAGHEPRAAARPPRAKAGRARCPHPKARRARTLSHPHGHPPPPSQPAHGRLRRRGLARAPRDRVPGRSHPRLGFRRWRRR